MARPRVMILRAPGTNCDEETAHAFALVGGVPERWHFNRVLEQPTKLDDFQVLCIPGGFSYGDDIAAGRILGTQIQHHLTDRLGEFHAAGKLILGICNGFQVLLNTPLLTPPDQRGPMATLTLNDSGRFEARWVRLAADVGNCVFLQGIDEMELPVAHAEGKFVTRDRATLAKLDQSGQLVLRYRARERCRESSATGDSVIPVNQPAVKDSRPVARLAYPDNPNGAMDDVAAVCDTTGRVLGMMPHPERFVEAFQHPSWTRRPGQQMGDGRQVFQNAVRYFA